MTFWQTCETFLDTSRIFDRGLFSELVSETITLSFEKGLFLSPYRFFEAPFQVDDAESLKLVERLVTYAGTYGDPFFLLAALDKLLFASSRNHLIWKRKTKDIEHLEKLMTYARSFLPYVSNRLEEILQKGNFFKTTTIIDPWATYTEIEPAFLRPEEFYTQLSSLNHVNTSHVQTFEKHDIRAQMSPDLKESRDALETNRHVSGMFISAGWYEAQAWSRTPDERTYSCVILDTILKQGLDHPYLSAAPSKRELKLLREFFKAKDELERLKMSPKDKKIIRDKLADDPSALIELKADVYHWVPQFTWRIFHNLLER